MIVGFTGTRQGLAPKQRDALRELLVGLSPTELHHGDCAGADAECHSIARRDLACRIVVHPPSSIALRAFCSGDHLFPARSYLTRNQDIVDACDVLIACPEGAERKGSGTWATVRMARKGAKQVYIVWSDGRVEEPKS